MFDVVIAQGNEEDFVEMALSLGYDEIVFLTRDSNYKYSSNKIEVKRGILVKNTNQVSQLRKRFDYIFAPAERQFFESKVDFIVDAEISERKDSYHYKRTALNQVHAKLCTQNNITVIFSFNHLFASKRLVSLGRMFQNAILAKKYSLSSQAFSMATETSKMKSRTTLDALLRVIGVKS